MSEKDQQKLSNAMQKAENAARIRLFGKASSQYRELEKIALNIEPSLAEGFRFLAALYSVNQDISDKKDPLETGTLRNLNAVGSTLQGLTLSMALPGGLFGEYETNRVTMEASGLQAMKQGLAERNKEWLEMAIGQFLAIGNDSLFFARYVSVLGRRVNGNRAALECEARKQILDATAIEDVNPTGAIPHYMLATRALRAARMPEEEAKHRKILLGLKKQRRCWICGRLVQGDNHFVNLEAEFSPYFEKLLTDNKEDLRVHEGQAIHVCVPCATAITNEADRIAAQHTARIMVHVNEMRLQIDTLMQILAERNLLGGGP